MTQYRPYIFLAAICATSLAGALLVPASDWIKAFIASPGVAALFGALLQLARDEALHERASQLQLDQQIFTLGANSHMAQVAFDKHVQFCEEYTAEAQESVGFLFREGATRRASEKALDLSRIRRRFAAWIPNAVSDRLDPFEAALMRIGADSHLVEALAGSDPVARSNAIDRAHRLLIDVLGFDRDLAKETRDETVALRSVLQHLRSVLGIEELTEIRRFIIQKSKDFMARSNNH